MFMTSLDQKCVREARKWRHAVRIPTSGISLVFLLEVFILKNEGVIAVLHKITFMTSLDQKCVREASKWRYAVRIHLAIIFIFT